MKFTFAITIFPLSFYFLLRNYMVIGSPIIENVDTFHSNNQVPTLSIMDILSSNETFTNLILTLQKSGIVDYVNGLENVTFLAPVNSAFDKNSLPYLLMSKSDINKFIINGTYFQNDINGVQILNTLNLNGSPYIDEFPIPILLDNREETFFIENAKVTMPDNFAVSVDSVVDGIDELLFDPKENICDYFENSLKRDTGLESFQVFTRFLINENYCKNMKLSNLTIFLPSDSTLDFNDIEINYLLNPRGKYDKDTFLSNFLANGLFGGNFGNNTILTTDILGKDLNISSKLLGDEIIVNEYSHSTTANYLLSDGIIHYFETRIFKDSITPIFYPRSYLIGLDQADFVDELDFRKLSPMIDNNTIEQTLFIPKHFNLLNLKNGIHASGNMKNNLIYHFAQGKLNLNKEILINSQFCSQPSLGHCQKLKVEKHKDGSFYINHHSKVISEKIEIGNTFIYFVDEDFLLPEKLEVALSSITGYSKTIEFLKYFGLLKFKSNSGHGYTIFLPTSNAWKELDLTLDYLLNNLMDLELIVKSLILNGLIYDDFTGSKNVTTLIDSNMKLERRFSNKTTLNINNKYEVPFSFEKEILFSDGIVHPINQIIIPESLSISLSDLITTIDSTEFEKILEIVGLSDVFKNGNNYSIILPTSKSLIMENITSNINNIKYLEQFARLHILPEDSLQKVLNCEDEIPTLLNGTHLSCRELASGGLMLSVKEGNDHEVRILRKGISTFGTGVLLIDRPINPSWIDTSNGPLHLHLSVIAILLGIVIGVFIIAAIISCCLVLTFSDESKCSNKNSNFNTDSANNNSENTPLLGPNSQSAATDIDKRGTIAPNNNNNNNTSNNVRRVLGGKPFVAETAIFSERYSSHSSSTPIDVNYN